MPFDPHEPIEPSPRMGDSPPAFVPLPALPDRAAGRARPPGAHVPLPPATTPRAWFAGMIAGAIALTFYVWGAAPTVLSGDSAEMATVAAVGGVPHPTGYPMFVLIGRATQPFLPGSPARRATLMCALMGSVSVMLFALLLSELQLSWAAVLAGALLYAGSFTLWWSSLRAEVYTVACALALFALWRVLVARRTLATRDGWLAAFALGLSLTGHLSFAPALAIAGLVLVVHAGANGRLSPGLIVGAAVAFALGLTPYLYLAYADRHFPLTSYLQFTVEPASGQFGITPARFDTEIERLRFLVSGAETRPHDFLHHPRLALVNFNVAWARFAAFEVGPLASVLALVGLRARDGLAALLLLAFALVTSAFSAFIVDGALLNVFMMGSVIGVLALAACGVDLVLARLGTGSGRTLATVAIASLSLAFAHGLRVRAEHRPLLAPWLRMEQEGVTPVRGFPLQLRGEHTARTLAEDTFPAIPESSFVAVKWERAMTMKYLQVAERTRRDLTIDSWYEPAHEVRISAWQHQHSLARRPVVVVGRIPGLVERLAAPVTHTLPDGTPLYIERKHVRTD